VAAQYHHAVDASQYHPAAEAAPAQYQDAHDDRHTDVADTHQTNIGEVEAPQNDMPDSAPAHTPDNARDTALGPSFGKDQTVKLIPLQHQL